MITIWLCKIFTLLDTELSDISDILDDINEKLGGDSNDT